MHPHLLFIALSVTIATASLAHASPSFTTLTASPSIQDDHQVDYLEVLPSSPLFGKVSHVALTSVMRSSSASSPSSSSSSSSSKSWASEPLLTVRRPRGSLQEESAFVDKLMKRVRHAKSMSTRFEVPVALLPESTSGAVAASGEETMTVELDLEQNTALVHPKYREVYFNPDTDTVELEMRGDEVPMCYYRGSVVGEAAAAQSSSSPRSHFSAAVSTCFGLHGRFVIDGEQYFIEPAREHMRRKEGAPLSADESWMDELHMVYRYRDVDHGDAEYGCAHADDDGAVAEIELESAAAATDMASMYEAAVAQGQRRLLQTRPTKYAEVYAVSDYPRFQQEGAATTTQALTLMNLAHDIFIDDSVLEYELSISIVEQIVFTGTDPFGPVNESSEVNVTFLLTRFANWTREEGHIAECINVGVYVMEDPDIDNLHLLSGRAFEGQTVGLAYVNGMCRCVSSGMTETKVHSDGFVAATIAHELGHNFGMRHDNTGGSSYDNTACPASGFIMQVAANPNNPPSEFSDCSRLNLNEYFASNYGNVSVGSAQCMEDSPAPEWTPVCGNGFLEAGETCDCNSTDCSTINPCCDGSTCQCITATCCNDATCAPYTPSDEHVCRPAANDCDFPEVCSGESSTCADVDDRDEPDGTSCDSGDGACASGTCQSLEDACEAQTPGSEAAPCAAQNDDCNNLYCSTDGGTTCTTSGATIADGSPCGSLQQCFAGICVESESRLDHKWYNGSWDTTCSGKYETRDVCCADTRISDSSCVEDETLCLAEAKPEARRCCDGKETCEDDDTITILGVELAKNEAYAAAGGAAVLLMLFCYCCCCKQSKGKEDTEYYDTEMTNRRR